MPWFEETDGKKEADAAYSDEELITQIDDVLAKMDKDLDGYISYTEYVTTERTED